MYCNKAENTVDHKQNILGYIIVNKINRNSYTDPKYATPAGSCLLLNYYYYRPPVTKQI